MLVVVALAFCVVSPSLGFSFVLYDDDYLVYRNKTIQDLSNLPRFFDPFLDDRSDMGSEYLPLVTASFALDHALYGLNPAGYHFTNALLYALGCGLLFLLLRGLGGRNAALVGALVFALHPLHTESTAWIAERKTLLNGLFVVLSLLAYLRFRRQGSRWALACSLLSFWLAFLSKYTAASFPLALACFDLTLTRDPARKLRDRLLPLAPFFLVTALMTALALHVGGKHNIVKPAEGHLPRFLATDPSLFLLSLKLLVLPAEQCAFYLVPTRTTPNAGTALGVAAFLALAGGAWAARARAPRFAFAAGWLLILLLPVSNLVPKGLWFAERYLYLPSLACAFLASAAWRAAGTTPSRRRLRRCLAAILLSTLALGFVNRSRVWENSVTLWEQTIAHPRGNPAAYDQLGLYYLRDLRRPQKALQTFTRGLADMDARRTPQSPLALRLRYHRVLALLSSKQAAQAQREWAALTRLCEGTRDPAIAAEYGRWRAKLEGALPFLFGPSAR